MLIIECLKWDIANIQKTKPCLLVLVFSVALEDSENDS